MDPAEQSEAIFASMIYITQGARQHLSKTVRPLWRWTSESSLEMQPLYHWLGEGVVHEYDEHARCMLHDQGRFEQQLGP